MSTSSRTTSAAQTRIAPTPLAQSRMLDYAMFIATSILIAGLYSDGWAHEHHLVDTFFTPWHGILYSGFLLSSAAPIVATFSNWRTTRKLRAAIPLGYELALFGGPLFILGGIIDEAWHRLVGFEINVETLLSPTHLFLLGVGLLLLSAPLRAQLLRGGSVGGWGAMLPAWVSLGYVFAVITFFTEYIQPFSHIFLSTPGSVYFSTAISVGSILFQSALYMGVLLFALRRWGLPIGSVTLLLTLSAGLQSLIHTDFLLMGVAVLGGILGDFLRAVVRPTFARAQTVRLFAFLTPAVLYAVYFAAFALASHLAWSITLWLGAIILAGGMGLLVSFAYTLPEAPASVSAK